VLRATQFEELINVL